MKKIIVTISVMLAVCSFIAAVLAAIDHKMKHRRYIKAKIDLS